MTSSKSNNRRELLKGKAKELLEKRDIKPQKHSFSNVDELIETLQMYQIELEIQNDELEKSHEVLLKNENRFRNLFDFAPVGYCIINEQGIVLEANHSFCSLLSVKAESVKRKSLDNLISINYQDAYYFHLKLLKKKNEVTTLVGFGKHPSQLHVKLHSTKYQLAEADEDVILCTFHNITNEINYQRELAISEERFRSLVSSTDDVIFTLDKDQRHTGVYGQWLEKFNQTPDDYIGKTAEDLFGKEMASVHQKHNAIALEGKSVVYDWFAKSEMGLQYFQTSLSPLFNSNREVVGIVGVARNTTDTIIAQQSLMERVKELDCLYDISVIGHKTNISIEEYMSSCLRIIPKGFVHKDRVMVKIDIYNETYSSKEFTQTDTCISTPIIVNGEQVGDISTCYKDSDLEKMAFLEEENKLIELIAENIGQVAYRNKTRDVIEESNQKLKALNAEKDKVVSIIGHDLRSPLSTILGIGNMLEKKYKTIQEDRAIQLIQGMNKTSEKVFTLLENLLDWARLQRGTLDYKPSNNNLLHLVNWCIDLYSESLDKKNITVNVGVDENLWVFSDANVTGTILRNLISNALKFTSPEGEIIINAFEKDDGLVEVVIKDNGIGMDPEMVANLFKIDGNAGREGTENEQSSGFGLILCKDLMKRLGGEIWVESQEGSGSVFHFTLPLGERG